MSGNVTEAISTHLASATAYELAGDMASASAEIQAALDQLGTSNPTMTTTLLARQAADVAASHVFNPQGT
jgi:hypothetical protein